MKDVVVIGAGVGGLSTALELLQNGYSVTVLESHIYAGGSAGTFFHKGYKFDAGATLAGGFHEGAPMSFIGKRFEIDWGEHLVEEAIRIHLPNQFVISRFTDPSSWREERISKFGQENEPFWQQQEKLADALWDFSMRIPPWLLTSVEEFFQLIKIGIAWLLESKLGIFRLASSLFSSFDSKLPANEEENKELKLFVDAQLLISAQAVSKNTNTLFSSVALDLYRQGVGHIAGGMGSIAEKLVTQIEALGGEVLFRKHVTAVTGNNKDGFVIHTKQNKTFRAKQVVFNMPKENIDSLLGQDREISYQGRWGAFLLYLGIDQEVIPDQFPLHHQIILSDSLSEGNSLFLSISPDWDLARAPRGKRAITISTHTELSQWWKLIEENSGEYGKAKEDMIEKILDGLETVIPNIRKHIDLLLPGTPITFERFTKRRLGWVGGFPQSNIFSTMSPRIRRGLWMVGDSIFPGQSVPGVALGGIRVGKAISKQLVTNKEI